MPPKRNAEREARERLRRYTARRTVHLTQISRRRRDNIVAATVVLVIAAIATVSQVAYFTSGPGKPVASPSTSASPSPSASAAEQNVGDVPSPDIAEGRAWTGTLALNDIPLGIRIDGDLAPQAASAFISLAQSDFYVGNVCTRLTTEDASKVIQCGAPNDTTSLDPGFSYGPVENAPVDGVYPAGTIAIARSDSQYSQSTQFFITYEDSTLDTSTGGYSVIGAVTSGLDQFTSQIASAGVAPAADGTASQDGTPAVATTITALSLQ